TRFTEVHGLEIEAVDFFGHAHALFGQVGVPFREDLMRGCAETDVVHATGAVSGHFEIGTDIHDHRAVWTAGVDFQQHNAVIRMLRPLLIGNDLEPHDLGEHVQRL